MRRIDPFPRAIVLTLGAVSLIAICGAIGFRSAYPDSGLMYAIAQVGIAVVFAYMQRLSP
jgi:hypothetical protein